MSRSPHLHVLLACALVACGEEVTEQPQVEAELSTDADDALDQFDAEETGGRFRRRRQEAPAANSIEGLESIGYAAGSFEADGDAPGGVVGIDVERAHTGLNLYTSGHAAEAVLMDMQGRELHRWQRDFADVWPERVDELERGSAHFWRRVHLYENGDLLAIHSGLGLLRLDEHSEVVWKSELPAHHDMIVEDSGEIIVLLREASLQPEVHATEPVLEDFVARLDPQGNELWRHSLLQAVLDPRYAEVFQGRRRESGDIFHTNSLELVDEQLAERLPGVEPGHLLVCILQLRSLAILDPATGELSWCWRHQLGPLHDPLILPDGDLLVFQNRDPLSGEQRSHVLRLDPLQRTASDAFPRLAQRGFFSRTCGTLARWSDGNVLVTESDNGRAFELDQEGALVWEFHSPHRAGPRDQLVATLFDVVRLPADFPTGWLDD